MTSEQRPEAATNRTWPSRGPDTVAGERCPARPPVWGLRGFRCGCSLGHLGDHHVALAARPVHDQRQDIVVTWTDPVPDDVAARIREGMRHVAGV